MLEGSAALGWHTAGCCFPGLVSTLGLGWGLLAALLGLLDEGCDHVAALDLAGRSLGQLVGDEDFLGHLHAAGACQPGQTGVVTFFAPIFSALQDIPPALTSHLKYSLTRCAAGLPQHQHTGVDTGHTQGHKLTSAGLAAADMLCLLSWDCKQLLTPTWVTQHQDPLVGDPQLTAHF